MREINKETIIDTAKRLMEIKGPSEISFRSVAREIGCAHTNLYNYFPDAEALILASGESVLCEIILAADEDTKGLKSRKARWERFYGNILRIYLDHPGWFHLLWSYPKHSTEEPEARIDDSIHAFVETAGSNLKHSRNYAEAHDLLHTVQAYLIGELSTYFSGRTLFKTRKDLEIYVVKRCVELTLLLDTEPTKVIQFE